MMTRQEAIERCARKGFDAWQAGADNWQIRTCPWGGLWIEDAAEVIDGGADVAGSHHADFFRAVLAESKIPEVAAALAQGDAPAPVEAEPWPYDDAIRRMAAEVARWAISNATRTSRNSEADLTEQLGRIAECFARLSMIRGGK